MAVRGFLFSSDVAMFMAVLAISAIFVGHFVSTMVDTMSNQNRVHQIRTSAEHAINVLLFAAKEEFRCTFGSNKIPVPACVWSNGGVNPEWFWTDGRFKCYVEASSASSTINSFLGCGSPPNDPETLVVVPFEFCWAGNVAGLSVYGKQSSIENCQWVEANLMVWA